LTVLGDQGPLLRQKSQARRSTPGLAFLSWFDFAGEKFYVAVKKLLPWPTFQQFSIRSMLEWAAIVHEAPLLRSQVVSAQNAPGTAHGLPVAGSRDARSPACAIFLLWRKILDFGRLGLKIAHAP